MDSTTPRLLTTGHSTMGNMITNPMAVRLQDVWWMDAVEDRIDSGSKLKSIVTNYGAITLHGLGIYVRFSLKGGDVAQVVEQLLMKHASPRFIRSDNIFQHPDRSGGTTMGTQTRLYTGIHSTRQGAAEWLRRELRWHISARGSQCRIFHSLAEVQIFSSRWLTMNSSERKHSPHNHRPPANDYFKQVA